MTYTYSSEYSSEYNRSKSYERAVKFGKHFHQVIYVPDEDLHPDDYIRELIEVYSGGEVDQLGSGLYATVYDGQDSTVFKVADASDNPGYLEYFAYWSKGSDNPFFPRVAWSALVLNEDQEEAYYVIQMEQLLWTGHEKVDKWASKYRKTPEGIISKLSDNIEVNLKIVLPQLPAVPKTFYEAKKIIRKIEAENDGQGFDLHSGNFMWREDGQIVITDPIA